MNKRLVCVAALALLAIGRDARAQDPPFGGLIPDSPSRPGSTIVQERPVTVPPPAIAKPRRASKNRFFARRPSYEPTPPGTRPRAGFEPYTSFIYPRGNKYPPLAPLQRPQP